MLKRVNLLYLAFVLSPTLSVSSQDAALITNLKLASSDRLKSFGPWVAFEEWESAQGRDLNGDGAASDVLIHLYDALSGRVVNLSGRLPYFQELSDRGLAFLVSELDHGEDLNGDGDAHDHAVVHVYDFDSAETTNLRIASGSPYVVGRWLAFSVNEEVQDMDLNGDGDTEDRVLHVHDLETGETRNLGVAGRILAFSEKLLVLGVSELFQGEDLNGDGVLGQDDDEDGVVDPWESDYLLFVHDLRTAETTNLRLTFFLYPFAQPPVLSEVWLVFTKEESQRGGDLNGDGDTEDRVLHVHDLETGETRNLGLSGRAIGLSGNWLVFAVYEMEQGEDLNGDGDTEDCVLHLHDLSTGETTDLKLAGDPYPVMFSGSSLVFKVGETEQGEDLNGDGEIGEEDRVLHVHDLETGETRNLGLSGRAIGLSGNWLVFAVDETRQGEDLNGDGDMRNKPNRYGESQEDRAIYVYNLETGVKRNVTLAAGSFQELLSENWLVFGVLESENSADLNGDGDTEDEVVHVHDIESGDTTNLVLAAKNFALSEQWLTFDVQEWIEGRDLNGDDDTRDRVVHVVDLTRLQALPLFLRGDCNGDGDATGVGDAIFLLSFNFLGIEPPPPCRAACNANGDGDIGGVTDAVFLLTFNFLGGFPPVPPFPRCGKSVRASDFELGCETPRESCGR